MTATVRGIHLGLDTHANRPAGNSCPDGSVYSCSTHSLIYVSNYAGNSWATWATLGGAAVDDATIATTDITTNNASTSKHGWLKKLDNNAAHYMDGSGAWSTPAGGSSGRVLLATLVAASSTWLDFATRNAAGQSGAIFQSDFTKYEIELENVIPATNNVSLLLRAGTGGGPTYDSGANYDSAGYYVYPSSSGITSATGTGQSAINIVDSVGNGAHYGVSGSIRLINPAGAIYKNAIGHVSLEHQSVGLMSVSLAGLYKINTALTAIRLLFSSGNIASGTISISGIA